jgi:hypothetical protein
MERSLMDCTKLRRELHLPDIDSIISAQIPADPGPLRNLVLSHMIHSEHHLDVDPTGTRGPSRCNKNGKCCYNYPHPPCPHTQLNSKQRIDYRRGTGDAWVVPYSPALLLLWEGHLNAEAVFTVDVFLYIYKYLFKGELPYCCAIPCSCYAHALMKEPITLCLT